MTNITKELSDAFDQDFMNIELSDIIDAPELQELMDDYFALTGFAFAILDNKGKALIAGGWQDICVKFHRAHAESCKFCHESDISLSSGIAPGTFKTYRCKNNLWEIATPIMLGDRHIGNIFVGQMFFDDEEPDYELFRSQAKRFGYDEATYIAALERVPRYSKEIVNRAMSFISKLAQMISKSNYNNIILADTLAKKELAEKALRNRESLFRTLVNTIPDLIWLKDADGVYLSCNKMFERFFGASEADIVGKTDYDFVTKELADFFRENDQKAEAIGASIGNEEQITFADDGAKAFLDTIKTPMFDSDGKLIGVLGIGRDITERKQTEEENRRFRTISDNAVYGKVIADLQGNLLYVNRFFAESHGYSPEELVGRHLSLFHSQEQMVTVDRLISSMVQEGYFAPTIVWHRRQNSTEFPMLMSSVLIKDDCGNPQCIAVTVIDMSAQHLTEEALRESEETHRALVDGLPDTVMRFDREGRHLFVSDNVREVVDIETAQFIGKTHAELGFPEAQSRFWEESIQRVFDSGAPLETEFTIEGKTGVTIFNWRLIPERNAQGAVSSVLTISRDITAHRKTEQDYKTLFQEMLDGFALHEIVCDAEGEPVDYRFLTVNPAFERMTGLKEEDIVGRTVLEVLPGTEKHWIKTYGKVALSGEPVFFKNQSAELGKYFEVTAFRPFAGQFVSIFKDITEHKIAEEALRESEERFKALHNASFGGIAIHDQGVILECNQGLSEISGFGYDELVGMDGLLLIAEQSRKIVMKNIHSGYEKPYEAFGVRKNGEEYPLRLEARKIPYKGKMVRVVEFRDIIEYKRAEEELRRRENQLQRIFEILPIGLWFADKDGTLLRGNPKGIEIWGAEPAVPLSEYGMFKAWRLPSREPIEADQWALSKTVFNGETIVDELLEIESFDGKRKTILNYTAPVLDGDGRMDGAIVVNLDISDRKALEDRLLQAQKMESIGTLAGGIAHDFNNILGAILGYAEMAQEDSPAGSILRKDIDQIVKASHRARELVKQILAFSRQAETEHIPLQAAFIIQEAIKMLRSSLPSTITIKQNINMNAGLILANPTQILQIVMNLCTNAFHAMEKAGGTLAISLEQKTLNENDIIGKPGAQSGDFVQLSIGDTGPGIAPELWDKVFDPYFTTKEVDKGTGMGLAIIHGIVKSYGGFVSFNSNPGKGTVFQVLLPVMAEEIVVENKPAENSQIGNERILFVDDEELLAEIGKNMLERLGYQVTVHSNSLEALMTFQNQPDTFDLVITDQTMPGMTGSDLARHILQIRPFMPIILCTGYSSIITEEMAKSHGIKGFAMKPLTRESIAVLIREVLDEGRLLSLKHSQ